NEEILTEETDIMNRWKEYFQELLENKEGEKQDSIINDLVYHQEDNELFVTEKEITEIIRELKNGKTAGYDKITAEMLKHMGDDNTHILIEIYNKTWIEEQIPDDSIDSPNTQKRKSI